MVINVQTVQESSNQYTGEQLRGVTDTRLSFAASGLWVRICNLPEDTEFTLEDLQKLSPKDNPEDVAAAYWELVDHGYIEE